MGSVQPSRCKRCSGSRRLKTGRWWPMYGNTTFDIRVDRLALRLTPFDSFDGEALGMGCFSPESNAG